MSQANHRCRPRQETISAVARVFNRLLAALMFAGWSVALRAQTTNLPPFEAPLPGAGSSVLRMFGALVFVLALFILGVWFFRRWQVPGLRRAKSPKLKILEMRTLGHRHALYVVGYEHQRLLIGASPAGLSLISSLPAAAASEPDEGTPAPATFMDALQMVLGRKS